MTTKIAIAKTGTEQKLTSLRKRVTFRAKISRMGDKIHIIILMSYHKDIEKQNFVDEFVDVDVSNEVNGE